MRSQITEGWTNISQKRDDLSVNCPLDDGVSLPVVTYGVPSMKSLRLLALILMTGLCPVIPVFAGQPDDGMKAFERGDYETAFKLSSPLAERGDANAQNNLATMYYTGRGALQDNSKAIEWRRKAAEQGHADAQYRLGAMYDYGHGAAQDYAEAVNWYKKSAEQGHDDAQYHLGLMLESGRGVAQDNAEAVNWYKKSAEQGHSEAQYNLALMYSFGEGTPQDYTEAYKWSEISAERSVDEPRDLALTLRDQVSEKMTPEQIEKARKLAKEWKPKQERSK